MAPTQNAGTADTERMLRNAFKCVSGTLDFDKLATKEGVANGEAMRKRFKRVFEKDNVDEPLTIKGCTLGNSSDGPPPATTTSRPPKTKAVAILKSNDGCSPNAKNAGKKRKAIEVSIDEQDDAGSPANVETAAKDGRKGEASRPVEGNPKENTKPARATPPNTPRTPKTTATPPTPKTPRTAKPIRSTTFPKLVEIGETGLEDNDHSV